MTRGYGRVDGKRIPTYNVHRPLVTASAPHDPPTRFPTASRPTRASGERRSHRRHDSDVESEDSRAWVGARSSSSSSRSRSPRDRSGFGRGMSPGGENVVSLWGKNVQDKGLEPSQFALQEWRRARRLPADPENPPIIGDKNPFGDWTRLRAERLLKYYGCRQKAKAFCPPEPDLALSKAFQEVELHKDTKACYKQCVDNMGLVGGSAHAMFSAMDPIFDLRQQVGSMINLIDEGYDPFDEGFGFGTLREWLKDVGRAISGVVFRGVKDAAILSAACFNNQVKTIRKMVVDHPRTAALPISIDKCPPSEEFFCGGHHKYLKEQMKYSKITDDVRTVRLLDSRFSTSRTSYSRGRGQVKGRTRYLGSRRPAYNSSSFRGSKPSTSKAPGNAPKRPSRGGRGAKRY